MMRAVRHFRREITQGATPGMFTTYKRRLCQTALIVAIVFHLTTADIQMFPTFYRVAADPDLGLIQLGPSWVDRDLLTCAVTCLRKYNTCQAFTFDPTTNLCTPGSGVNRSQPTPSADSRMYATQRPIPPGFMILEIGNTKACIGVFEGLVMNFAEATAFCLERGGRLMTLKTPEKYQMLRDKVDQNLGVWIGADDFAQEGVFRWQDDGSLLNFSLFDSSQPEPNSDGDCVRYRPSKDGLADTNCSLDKHFACEIDMDGLDLSSH